MNQQNIQKRRYIGAVLAALTITMGPGFTTQAQAQSGSGERNVTRLQQIEDVGGPQRIDHSGKLRMLSQRIPAAACILSTSPDSEFMRESLISARDKFDRVLIALRDGDDELGIVGVETDRRILHNLDIVMEQWTPFKVAIDDIIAGNDVEKNLEFLAANNMALLEAAVVLVSQISAEYSHPAEMSAAGAILVNISGRQRMLSQMIAKQSCGAIKGVEALGTPDEMHETLSTFNAVMNALHNGQTDAGVQPPPTDEIREKLGVFIGEWQNVESTLSQVTGVGSIDSEVQVQLFQVLTKNVNALSEIVGLYSIAARIGG